MVLSGRTIKEELAKRRIVIEPPRSGCIQPACIDIHPGRKLLIFKKWREPFYIDANGKQISEAN
jgi:deoxycytidine triphosphate deaminase